MLQKLYVPIDHYLLIYCYKVNSSYNHALQKKIAIRLFWEAFNSDRINRTTFINKADAQMMAEKYELDLDDEMKVLTIDFSMVDQICMPCKRRSLKGINLYWT